MKLTWDTKTNKVTSDAMPFLVAQCHEAATLDDAARVLPVGDKDEARVVAWLLRKQEYPRPAGDAA